MSRRDVPRATPGGISARCARYGAALLIPIGACVPTPAGSSRPTVAIDPGHPSETSSGAEVQHGTTEVHVAWEIAQRVRALLRDRGYDVVLTKSNERQLVTNRERAD